MSLAISPDGNTIVYVDTVGGVRQLWAKDRERLDGVPVAGTVTPSGNMGPTFSPDGEWIAFVADGKVKRVPRLGGSAITVADSANSSLPALAWLDDGTILYNNTRYDLQSINVEGSESRRVINVDSLSRGVVAVAPLPGGRGALVIPCTLGCSESDLRVLDLRTGALRVLTNEVLRAWYVPSGDVVFVRRDGGVFMAPFDLDKLAFRTAPVPVLDGVRTSPTSADITLSPSGTLLYVGGTASAVIQLAEAVWVTREGLVSPVDPSWSFQPSLNSGLAMSPDGRRLAVSAMTAGKQDIWVKELPAGPFTRLTFDGSNARPAWTADGRTVMYTTLKPGKNDDLGARRSDGTGVETILFDGARGAAEVLRTRDTTRFIVRLGAPPSRDIVLVERTSDSAKATALVANDGYDEVHPALSPDGRWLAYASNESGRYEVYVRPFPDANGGRWQVSRNGGYAPGWAHSGRELFFRDGAGAMIAVAVKSGAAFELGELKTLFPATDLWRSSTTPLWAITPDDRRFVFLRNVGTQAAVDPVPVPVIRVDNWLAELKAGSAKKPR